MAYKIFKKKNNHSIFLENNIIITGPYKCYASKLFVNNIEIFKIVSLLLGLKRFVVFDINR